jgi:hypothetical protein
MDQVDEVLGYRRPSGEIKENIKGGGGKSYSHKLVYIVCLPQ